MAASGELSLLTTGGITALSGMGPIDADVTDGNDVLYTLNAKDHSFGIYAIGAEGALTKRPELTGLPEFAVGLVAR